MRAEAKRERKQNTVYWRCVDQRDQQRGKESWGARGRGKRQKNSRKATQGEHNQGQSRTVLAATAHRIIQGMEIVQAKMYGNPKGEK